MSSAERKGAAPGRSALGFVVLLGVVSLFADMTYEGARSITGPFMASLGASAAAVGIVAGAGELVGYGLRLVSGYLADRTGRYWAITLWGYALNLIAVPLLALAGSWETAAFLIVAERLGKAIRTPARDAMLSHATAGMGRGWGFGLHEALDQVGAVLGPLVVAAVLYFRGGYSWSFGVLLAPAVLALCVLLAARRLHPQPRSLEAGAEPPATETRFPRVFWLYLGFIAASVAGYAHFQLASYHLESSGIASTAIIPVLFAIAMGVDALAALISGRLYDRAGLAVLLSVPLLTLPVAPLMFSSGYGPVVAGVVLWGAVLGVQETIMRAAVADMIPANQRGAAYGIFNAVYGLSWFAGSALMGVLYGIGIFYLVAYAIVLQTASLLPLLAANRLSRA